MNAFITSSVSMRSRSMPKEERGSRSRHSSGSPMAAMLSCPVDRAASSLTRGAMGRMVRSAAGRLPAMYTGPACRALSVRSMARSRIARPWIGSPDAEAGEGQPAADSSTLPYGARRCHATPPEALTRMASMSAR